MNGAARIACEIGGTLLTFGAGVSMISVLVIPRGTVGILYKVVDRSVDLAFRLVLKHLRYETRDRFLAGEAPAIVLALLVLWLGFLVVGFALILLPGQPDFTSALREAASSMFTLGFYLRTGSHPPVVDFVAAATGMIVIALQIGYLPTLYGAYNRRETEVALLGIRAGTPPWGPQLLANAGMFGMMRALVPLYESWERWAADVTESHASYPVLLRFRSPHDQNSWVVALLAILDSAAMYLAIAPKEAPLVQLNLTLRAGFTCFRRLAEMIKAPVDHDPLPTDPISLSFEEFAVAYQAVAGTGFPVGRSAEEAWPHFRGWRVNYESAAHALARELDVVPVLWSGPRRTRGRLRAPTPVINRSPDDPHGLERSAVQVGALIEPLSAEVEGAV